MKFIQWFLQFFPPAHEGLVYIMTDGPEDGSAFAVPESAFAPAVKI